MDRNMILKVAPGRAEPVNTYDRSIIHLNVADFAVAVERAVDCRLKDRPVIIAPRGRPGRLFMI